MLRSIAAVLLGYVVVVFVTFTLFTTAWLALGADGAFEPGSWEVSPVWAATSVVVGLLAALAAGWTCRSLAATDTPVYVLAGLFLVAGLATALMTPTTEAGVRPASVGMFDAMQSASTPVWLAYLNPLLGVAGALAGGSLRRK